MNYVLDILSTLLVVLALIGIMTLISNRLGNKLSNKKYKGWLIAHVIFVIVAVSGLLGNFLLTVVSTIYITGQDEVYTAHFLTRYFCWFLIIPGILGSFITGIWLALRTKWGLTKYYWIIAKILGTIAAILFGSTWMPIWLEKTTTLSLQNIMQSAYFHSRQMLLIGIAIALIIMFFLIIISYLKPWGKRVLPNK